MRFFQATPQSNDDVVSYRRVNVVMHGLMAFWVIEPGYYDILIPRPKKDCTPHFARFGKPPKLHDFPVDSNYPAPTKFHLDGVIGASASQECRPSTANALLLQSALIDLHYESILVIVRVPKPNMIRHYRGAETHGRDLTGGHAPTHGCLVRPPDVVHDITVFSYFAFEHPFLKGPKVDYAIAKNDLGAGNLHIYCQPVTACNAKDSEIFSSMFHIKSAGCSPKIDLALSGISDDGPPKYTADWVGIDPVEWGTLAEFEAMQEKNYDPLAAAPGGCGGAFGS